MVVEWVRALRAEETSSGPDPVPVGTIPEGFPRTDAGTQADREDDERADPR